MFSSVVSQQEFVRASPATVAVLPGQTEKGLVMRRTMIAILVVIGLVLAVYVAEAAADQERVIAGEGACAKCILKETKECQLAITADEGGKQLTYYVAPNNVSKHFGHQVCSARKEIKAVGLVKNVQGKLELT